MRQVDKQTISSEPDHRVKVAARKRASMRARLIEATMKVFAEVGARLPTIEDVVRVAGVSRGTFYLHFLSLEEALQALSLALNDQMMRDIHPVYDIQKEPWQRFSVGFRIALKWANADPAWASFVSRSTMPFDTLLVTTYMKEDLRRGRDMGQFSFADLNFAVDFIMGALIAGIRTLGRGVADPANYMDEYVRMALFGLGSSSLYCDRGVKFSRAYLEGWRISRSGDAGGSFESPPAG